MRPVLSREQMRAFDQTAIRDGHVPGVVLMENAGRGAAEHIAAELERRPELAPVLIVCGPGNNGGDGFVIARHLLTYGHAVEVVLTTALERLKGDARLNADAWCGLDQPVHVLEGDGESGATELAERARGAGSIVDALLGTGLDREVHGLYRAAIEVINAAGRYTWSIDIPSGIDSNTGAVLGAAVRAQSTLTFAHYKLGLLTGTAAEHAGDCHVLHIGVPGELYTRVGSSARLLETHDVAARLVPRGRNVHKASAGRVVVIAGSPGKTGAALLVARAAMRSGAGLVTIASFDEAVRALDMRVLEEMTACIDENAVESSLDALLEGATAVAIGPGLGLDERARRVVQHVVSTYRGKLVMDADALTHFSGRVSELSRAAGQLILTPHPGEMGRLLARSTREVESARFDAVERCAQESGATVLLKGPCTIIGARGELPVINAAGTPALATAGAGDVLAGICAALACSLDPFEAAFSAAHVHGLAAQRWASDGALDRGLLAHEIADQVPDVLAGLRAR